MSPWLELWLIVGHKLFNHCSITVHALQILVMPLLLCVGCSRISIIIIMVIMLLLLLLLWLLLRW